jgi:hypothetical protein
VTARWRKSRCSEKVGKREEATTLAEKRFEGVLESAHEAVVTDER